MPEKVERKSKSVINNIYATAKIHFDFQNVFDVLGCFPFRTFNLKDKSGSLPSESAEHALSVNHVLFQLLYVRQKRTRFENSRSPFY